MRKKISGLSQLLALFLMLYSFSVSADDLKVLHKIEFKKTAPKKLLLALLQGSHYYDNETLPQQGSFYEKFDLNNDKSKEYFLRIVAPGWCGAGNCPVFIFEKKGNIIRSLLEASSGAEVYILQNKTNGYHDITFFPKIEINRNIWHWNGKQYN